MKLVQKLVDRLRTLIDKTVNLNKRKYPIRWIISLTLIVLAIIAGYWLFHQKSEPITVNNQTPVSTDKPEEKCSGSFEMKDFNNPVVEKDAEGKDIVIDGKARERIYYEGLSAIKNAKTAEEKENAINDWAMKSRQYKQTYELMRLVILGPVDSNPKNNPNLAVIPEIGSCAGTDIRDEFMKMKTQLLMSKLLTGEEATAAGIDWKHFHNTYREDGGIAMSPTAGTYGDPIDPNDQSVIVVILPDGRMFAVMGVCGNVLVPDKDKDHHHKGKRHDKDEKKYLEDKKPSQDPAQQGNAPVGGGPNIDKSAGKYIAPANMKKPGSTARTNPSSKTKVKKSKTKTTTIIGSTGSTTTVTVTEVKVKDETPAPKIEEAAPNTPAKPADKKVVVPGL